MFDWLTKYQEREDEITLLEFELSRYKLELERWTIGDLAKYKLEPESRASKLEEIIEALQKEIDIKKKELDDMKQLIASFRGLDNQILYYKYCEGMTLEKIAEKLGYSEKYIYKKHSEIKRMLEYANRQRKAR